MSARPANKDEARCDHCRSPRLTRLYPVPTSQRGLSVYQCQACALVQSLPRTATSSGRKVAVSAGANWGNVRYGKGFRTRAAIGILQRRIDLGRVEHCLDVGANRGSFVLALHALTPGAAILAVEPDSKVVGDYLDHPAIEVVQQRIETLSLAEERFDLIYCSHTLEHLHSPAAVLQQLHRAMRADGLLLLEVPNIAFIGGGDVVEEWFIDKHLYHYSPATLVAALEAAGFHCPADQVVSDSTNITVMATKGEARGIRNQNRDVGTLTRQTAALLQQYERNLRRNHQRLAAAARHIEAQAAAGRRIVFWGAGRIFDALISHGGLKPGSITALVDKQLPHFVSEMHGLTLQLPGAIAGLAPDLVIITSRQYEAQIRAELEGLRPGTQSLSFGELLDGALA